MRIDATAPDLTPHPQPPSNVSSITRSATARNAWASLSPSTLRRRNRSIWQVGGGAFADDVEGVAHFLLAAQGAGVVGQFFHQFGGEVRDVLAAAVLGVAVEAESKP